MKIDPSDLRKKIISCKDGGCDVETSGWCKRADKSATSEVYVGKDGKVWLPQVRQRIEEIVKVDNEFLVGFVLFTLGTLLYPPSGEESSSSNFLVPLRDPKEIYKNKIKLG